MTTSGVGSSSQSQSSRPVSPVGHLGSHTVSTTAPKRAAVVERVVSSKGGVAPQTPQKVAPLSAYEWVVAAVSALVARIMAWFQGSQPVQLSAPQVEEHAVEPPPAEESIFQQYHQQVLSQLKTLTGMTDVIAFIKQTRQSMQSEELEFTPAEKAELDHDMIDVLRDKFKPQIEEAQVTLKTAGPILSAKKSQQAQLERKLEDLQQTASLLERALLKWQRFDELNQQVIAIFTKIGKNAQQDAPLQTQADAIKQKMEQLVRDLPSAKDIQAKLENMHGEMRQVKAELQDANIDPALEQSLLSLVRAYTVQFAIQFDSTDIKQIKEQGLRLAVKQELKHAGFSDEAIEWVFAATTKLMHEEAAAMLKELQR